MNQRKIIHVDMDAFYASIEQRDHPEYRGKPIAVGRPEMRGVVAAASYEARRFGVRSAMPSMKALKLCPHLIFTRNRMDVYKAVSAQIHAIFHRYTDLVEPLSLDEAFLDVTENKPGIPLAVDIARRIKKEIRRELHLTASAGVSYNKFLAKIASDYRKPDGLFTIHPSRAEKFIAALPIEAFWGVGHATAERMRALSITNGAQLRARDKDFLVRHFGKTGAIFYNFARGVDDRPVEPSRMRKSVGCEETYRENVTRAEALEQRLPLLAEELAGRLARSGFRGNTLTLKVKFPDFVQKTRCATVPEILTEKEGILPLARTLVRHFGKTGAIFYNFARGVDDRPVEPSRMRKSVGCEETYRENVTRAEALEQRLPLLAEELAGRLARSGFRGNTLTLKVKFPDFVQKTRCATVPEILTEKEGILPLARTLMEELDSGDRTFRLLGLSVSHPQEEQRQGIWEQLWLELEY